MLPKAETDPAQNHVEQRWHHNFWVRLGACGLLALSLIYVANEKISDQRTSLETNLGSKIDPAAEDIDEFMERSDQFFEDYQQFRVDICQSALGTQMDGCEQILSDVAESNAEEASTQAPPASAPATTVTTVP